MHAQMSLQFVQVTSNTEQQQVNDVCNMLHVCAFNFRSDTFAHFCVLLGKPLLTLRNLPAGFDSVKLANLTVLSFWLDGPVLFILVSYCIFVTFAILHGVTFIRLN